MNELFDDKYVNSAKNTWDLSQSQANYIFDFILTVIKGDKFGEFFNIGQTVIEIAKHFKTVNEKLCAVHEFGKIVGATKANEFWKDNLKNTVWPTNTRIIQ